MTDVRRLGERAQAMLDALGAISADDGRITRLYLTPEHRRAIDLVTHWMKAAGMSVRLDNAATLRGVYDPGKSAKRLLVGSHVDTIVDAGRYDGTLGVVAAILAVEELARRGTALPFAVEVLAFGDEEGVRFPKTLLGSSAVAGIIAPDALEVRDADGMSVREALAAFGSDPGALAGDAYRREAVVGYLEVHIEQGPVLEAENRPLGIVSAIAAQGRYRLTVRGEAGHAGTVPMGLRRDALAAAAEVVLAIEKIARAGTAHALVGTVGEIAARPGASNVIPGEARFSLDLRAATDEARQDAAEEIRERVADIAARRGVTATIETVHEKPVATSAPRLRRAIAAGLAASGVSEPRELMSGAGHDGQAMIALTDIGMIFVRCRGGISHNPLEFVSVDDLDLAVEALVGTIVALASDQD